MSSTPTPREPAAELWCSAKETLSVEPETIEKVLALIESRPTDAELYQLLGGLYRKEHRLEEARAAYEQSLTLDPNDPFTHLYLGSWHWSTGNPREALKWFKQGAKLLPNEAVGYWCQGDAFRAMGRYREAEAMYKKAVRVDPDDPQARRMLSKWRRFRKGEESSS